MRNPLQPQQLLWHRQDYTDFFVMIQTVYVQSNDRLHIFARFSFRRPFMVKQQCQIGACYVFLVFDPLTFRTRFLTWYVPCQSELASLRYSLCYGFLLQMTRNTCWLANLSTASLSLAVQHRKDETNTCACVVSKVIALKVQQLATFPKLFANFHIEYLLLKAYTCSASAFSSLKLAVVEHSTCNKNRKYVKRQAMHLFIQTYVSTNGAVQHDIFIFYVKQVPNNLWHVVA